MNILTELGYFSEEQRGRLLLLPKFERNVVIGKMLKKDKNMVTALEDGFIEARYNFLSNNNIDASDVLSIKRDAIFLIGKYTVDESISEYVKIRPKGSYTCYINLLNREHYFNTDDDTFEVKGYSNESFDVLNQSLFKVVRDVLKFDIMKDKDNIFFELVQFKDDLLTGNLPKEYFYDPILNGYTITSAVGKYSYVLPNIVDSDKSDLSVLNILRFINELISYTL